jgi:hypothetical protein
MQADRGSHTAAPTDSAAPASAPRYRNVVHAFTTIARSEGLKGLYRGVGPTMQRAAVIAGVELASYDEAKVRACER